MSFRFFAVLLTAALSACGSAIVKVDQGFDFTRVRRVAVAGFPDSPSRAGSGRMVADAFAKSLAAAGYDVVGPDAVAKAAAEQNVGSIDEKAARAVGQALNVDAMVTGKITALDVPPADVAADTSAVVEAPPPVAKLRNGSRHGPPTAQAPVDASASASGDGSIGRLGVSAQMINVRGPGILWSAADDTETDSLKSAASILSDEILKALKRTWRKP
jgi:hypothetical protein